MGCRAPLPKRAERAAGPVIAADTNLVIALSERPTHGLILSEATGELITPGIDVYANGRCIIRNLGGAETEKQISSAEVTKLLQAIDRSGFFELSSAALDARVKALQVGRGIKGANHTAVFARVASKTNRIERYALDWELEWYPEMLELGVLRDVVMSV